MANLHEIKAHIANIEATKKITRAMYLISASKSQRAKSQLEVVFPYFQHITATMAEIFSSPDMPDTPYIMNKNAGRQSKRDLYVVVGADKGMAGGYGHNIIDLVTERVEPEHDELLVAGASSRIQLRNKGYMVDRAFAFPVMNPTMYRARDIAEIVVDQYLSGKYRDVFLAYTEMVSPLKQTPRILQLLPLDEETLCERAPDKPITAAKLEYSPSERAVFDHLVPHYVKGILYSALVEAFSSEQAARMMAMDSATKNADESIDRLSIEYNHARQAKITQELTEIISGIPEDAG